MPIIDSRFSSLTPVSTVYIYIALVVDTTNELVSGVVTTINKVAKFSVVLVVIYTTKPRPTSDTVLVCV